MHFPVLMCRQRYLSYTASHCFSNCLIEEGLGVA
uniref:Uncharacterized protein n=1 Tax=Anguilla anguilla TaxID=7936 RepID=A0A0E9UID8_ANGAN